MPEQGRYVLEVDPGSDPVSGRVRDDAGTVQREFSGWLALAAALEWMAGAQRPVEEAESR